MGLRALGLLWDEKRKVKLGLQVESPATTKMGAICEMYCTPQLWDNTRYRQGIFEPQVVAAVKLARETFIAELAIG